MTTAPLASDEMKERMAELERRYGDGEGDGDSDVEAAE